MQVNKDKRADVVQPIDADTSIQSICDSLEQSSRRSVKEMFKKTVKRQKYIEELTETMRNNDAAIATDRRKAIELKNKCIFQGDKLETQKAIKKKVIDKLNMMYATTKLMKSHCSIQKKLSKDIEDMQPRVEHYVTSVEHLVTDAGRKMALKRRQVEQERASLKQRIRAHTEKGDSWEKKHLKRQKEIICTGLESKAAMQVMQSKLDDTVAAETRVKQDIEQHLMQEKEVEHRLILLKQKVQEVRRGYSKEKSEKAKDISDLEISHLESEQEERSLQEELVTEENLTKQVGEESSRLQERLLTMEDSITTKRAVLEGVTEQFEGLKKYHDDVMGKQSVLTEERDLIKQKLQDIEAELQANCEELKQRSELLSTRYWQELDGKAEWARREDEITAQVDTMRGLIDSSTAVLKAIRQRRDEKIALVQLEEEAKSVRESLKDQMMKKLISKREELESLVETTKDLKRNLKSASCNSKTRRCNERIATELEALRSDCQKQEEQMEVTRKRKLELMQMEDSLSKESAIVQELASKVTQDVDTVTSDLANVKDIMEKEERELLQYTIKITAKLSALKERAEAIRNCDIKAPSSVLTDEECEKLREYEIEFETMQKEIEQHKLVSGGKSKYQNDLMSGLQTAASNRANTKILIMTHGNDIKFLKRKVAKTKANQSVEERNLLLRSMMPPPSDAAGHHFVRPKSSHTKPESDLDFDFSDY